MGEKKEIEPDDDEQVPATKKWWAKVPAMAAFARLDGRKKSGRQQTVLTYGELRYLVAVGAFTSAEGFCRTSQRTIANRLGVANTLVARWERGLCAKGFAESSAVLRVNGKWRCRVLKILYPEHEVRADGSIAPISSPVSNTPSRAKQKRASNALIANQTCERPEVHKMQEAA